MAGHDAIVHGHTASGAAIVRYDRAGKWYIEPTDGKRRRVTVTDAAHAAALGVARLGCSGGVQFDAKVRAEWAKAAS